MKKLLLILMVGINLSIFANEGFIEVIQSRDIDAIKSYYNEHKPEDGLLYSGFSPVHIAVRTYNIDVLKTILDLGYSPNYKQGEYRVTPLRFASEMTSAKEFQTLLLDYGAEIYDMEDGSSSFMFALEYGRDTYITLLLDRGIDLRRAISKDADPVELLLNRWRPPYGVRLLKELYKEGYIEDKLGKYLHMTLTNHKYTEPFDLLLSYANNIDYVEDDLSLIYRALTEKIPYRDDRIKKLLEYKPALAPPLPGGRPLILEYINAEIRIARESYTRKNTFLNLESLLKLTPKKDYTYGDESVLSGIAYVGTRDQIDTTLENYTGIIENKAASFQIFASFMDRGRGDWIPLVDQHLTYSDYISSGGWSILGVQIHYDYTIGKIDYLLSKGLDINTPGYKGQHILAGLSKKDDFETMIYLAKKGAVIESEDVIYKNQRWNKRTNIAIDYVGRLRELGAIKDSN